MFASTSSSLQRTTAPVLQAAVRNQPARFLSGVEMGSPDAIMAIKEHGLKLKEKFNTDNSIGATVDYEKLMRP